MVTVKVKSDPPCARHFGRCPSTKVCKRTPHLSVVITLKHSWPLHFPHRFTMHNTSLPGEFKVQHRFPTTTALRALEKGALRLLVFLSRIQQLLESQGFFCHLTFTYEVQVYRKYSARTTGLGCLSIRQMYPSDIHWGQCFSWATTYMCRNLNHVCRNHHRTEQINRLINPLKTERFV